MMPILAIDTSTEACSVALLIDSEPVFEIFDIIPRGHTQRIMPMIQEVLAHAQLSLTQLSAIAFGRGPGAFTGLRIAAGVVQGLAYGADLPVIPVSTLAALAQGAIRVKNAQYILPAIDARMGEVYWACYELQNGLAKLLNEEQVSSPTQVITPEALINAAWYGVGTGWSYHDNFTINTIGYEVEQFPHAQDIATLAIDLFRKGEVVSADKAVPIYIRDKVTG